MACVICRSVGATVSDKNKQKLLNKSRCSVVRGILNELWVKLFRQPCECLVEHEMRSPNAVICIKCQRRLRRIKKLEEELTSTLGQIYLQLTDLHHCGNNGSYCIH